MRGGREVRGSSRVRRARGVTAAARFLGTRDGIERRDLVARLQRRGSRETRDAPGGASDVSVAVSRSTRLATRAWRDDSLILARLRPSAPQTVQVVARDARRRRGEEGLRARRVASVLWTGSAARDEARADVRRGETGERERRRAGACAAGRHADEGEGEERLARTKRLDSRNRRNVALTNWHTNTRRQKAPLRIGHFTSSCSVFSVQRKGHRVPISRSSSG